MTIIETWEVRRREPSPGSPDGLQAPQQVRWAPITVEEESTDLLALFRLFYRDRFLLLAVISIATLISTAVALTSVPVYQAQTLLAPMTSDKNERVSVLLDKLGGLESLVGAHVGGSRGEVTESVATLRSRSLALDFIRERNLKPALFPEAWDAERGRWRDPASVPTDLDAYELFDRQVRRVQIDQRTGLVSLIIEWRDPQLAATWANELVRRVNERRRAEVIRKAQSSIAYLQQQAGKTASVEIVEVIYGLIQAQTKTITLAKGREEFAFSVIDPAVTPERPVRPNRVHLVIMGLALGVIVAIGITLLRHVFRRAAKPRRGATFE